MTHPTDVDVLIVGAGPTGLSFACLLAQLGVRFRIIEKNKTITERSKALAVQARTLELFEYLELADKAVEMGHPAEGLDLVIRGKSRASFDLSSYGQGLTKYPYVLILEQNKTEKLLLDKLESLGGKVEWQRELVDLTQHPESVTAEVTAQEKIETIRAKYLVAADGARSSVRSFLQLPFEGGTYENHFLLGDLKITGPVSRKHITLCLSQYGFAGFFPMYGTDRFRAIGGLSDEISEKQKDNYEVVAEEIKRQAQLPIEISDPRWISTYKLHHRNVLHFKVQRCFFAGDAAHIHSPAGGQGMNTGIQDAFNLAWKLAFALSGRATPSILNTYHEERFPIARKLIHSTDRVFSFVTKRGFIFTWCRLFLMPPVVKFLVSRDAFRSWIFRVVSQTGINYRSTSLTYHHVSEEGRCQAGDRFIHSPVIPGSFFIAYLVGEQEIQQKVMVLLERYLGDQVKIYTLDKSADLHSVLHSFGIHKDGILIVRPDGYVGFSEDALDLKSLQHYLSRFFIAKGAPQEKRPDDKEAFPFESFI